MEGTAFFDMAELLREAALQEAASRAKTRSPLNTVSAASSSSQPQRISAEVEAEAEELFAVYEDEKAKNDALARSLDQVSASSLAHATETCNNSLLASLLCLDVHRDWKRLQGATSKDPIMTNRRGSSLSGSS